MLNKGSAGGIEEANPNAERPSEREAKDQVGEIGRLPEFTNLLDIAENFGTEGYVCLFEIESKYLTRGSGTEKGWISHNDAPMKLIGWKMGRVFFDDRAQKSSKKDPVAKLKDINSKLPPKGSSPGINLQKRNIIQEAQPKKGSLKRV